MKSVTVMVLALLLPGCITQDECDEKTRKLGDECAREIKTLGKNLGKQCVAAIDKVKAKCEATRTPTHGTAPNPCPKTLSNKNWKACHRNYGLAEIAAVLTHNQERLAETAKFFAKLRDEKDQDWTMPKRSDQIQKFLKCIFEERVKGRGGIPHVCK